MLPGKSADIEIKLEKVETKPIEGQKPGTSGLRKKVKLFQTQHYLENFIQSYFLSFRKDQLSTNNVLLVGGDGRFYNVEAAFKIIRLACANGVSEVHIAKGGLMSTPAVSAYIRKVNAQVGNCLGAILLTASHNPGGPDQDFGVKFNVKNGGPAPQQVTNQVYAYTTKIVSYLTTNFDFSHVIDINKTGTYTFANVKRPLKKQFVVKVVESVEGYVDLMKSQFDFNKIKGLFARKDFTFCFDAMHGIAGPYAVAIFEKELGCSPQSLKNCDVLPDFGGLHPDPNLIYAKQLVEIMGLGDSKPETVPEFGAACDGDADRNMILGKRFFVTPSDSVAILASNSSCFLKHKITGVARSMPTSGALDNVAKKMGINLFETPTGWKFFGNLMDTDLIDICGQESFGTGSSHVREKDGIWTILAWLTILATKNETLTEKQNLFGVECVVKQFWKQYGRNYYSRYDYQGCQLSGANKCWQHLLEQVEKHKNTPQVKADIYSYIDPVDQSISNNQGIRFMFPDGSRVIFRQSGTGSVGMTIRVYFQKYQPNSPDLKIQQALKELIEFGLTVSKIGEFTGRKHPDVIT